MKTRHSNELLACLEQIIDVGYCSIRKSKLRLWYATQRITSSVFDDILDKWTQELEQKTTLLVADSSGEYVFIWGDGLDTDGTGNAWFKDINEFTKKPTKQEKQNVS